MSKTAEEILSEKYSPVGEGEKYTYTLTKYVIEAMHEFAAQEVEAYKERLTADIEDMNRTRRSWLLEKVIWWINDREGEQHNRTNTAK